MPYNDRPPFVDGDAPSEAAADDIEDVVGYLRLLVYKALERHGLHGATCDELEVELQMRHQTCSARLRELYLMNRTTRLGDKRRTRSGRVAWVHRIRYEEARSKDVV